MKVVAIFIIFVNLGLSQVLNTDEVCDPEESCSNQDETSALVCEYVVLQPRIDENEELIRDTNVRPNGFPHMAAIGYSSANNEVDWLCSGSLISRKHVLTVAHCLEIKNGRKAIWVRLGDTNLQNSTDDFNAQTYPIKKCVKHPKYNGIQKYHDIGIIYLEGKASLVPGVVEPACLPMSPLVLQEKGLVTDWGRSLNTDLNVREQKLMRSDHEFLPMETCNQSFGVLNGRSLEKILPEGLSNETMVCARALLPDTASCAGSSGGPLEIEVNQQKCAYSIVGLTSFGFGCNKINEPTIYTKVYYYLSWIQNVVCGPL